MLQRLLRLAARFCAFVLLYFDHMFAVQSIAIVAGLFIHCNNAGIPRLQQYFYIPRALDINTREPSMVVLHTRMLCVIHRMMYAF